VHLAVQVIHWRFLKDESYRHTLYHIPAFAEPLSKLVACATVLYKKPCQSLIPLAWGMFADQTFNAKIICHAEFHCKLAKMYGEGVKNKGNLHEWCCLINACVSSPKT
jgi:hypothetical protein